MPRLRSAQSDTRRRIWPAASVKACQCTRPEYPAPSSLLRATHSTKYPARRSRPSLAFAPVTRIGRIAAFYDRDLTSVSAPFVHSATGKSHAGEVWRSIPHPYSPRSSHAMQQVALSIWNDDAGRIYCILRASSPRTGWSRIRIRSIVSTPTFRRTCCLLLSASFFLVDPFMTRRSTKTQNTLLHRTSKEETRPDIIFFPRKNNVDCDARL